MKRTLVSVLLPLGIWAGCDNNEVPNTQGNCKGLVTVNLTVPGGVNSAKVIASTAIGPEGVRYQQVDVPPLAVPNVVLRQKDTYRTGNQVIRVVAADGDPSKGATAVTAVARLSTNLQTACPSVSLALTATKIIDICYDRCDAEVRCGQRPFTELDACQDDCQKNEPAFTQQQSDWSDQYENATDVINELEGCNFVACGGIESCGETVMKSAVPKL